MRQAGDSHEITFFLDAWRAGDREALDELAPRVLAELRRLASHYLDSEPAIQSLQTTSLVNELFVKLLDGREPDWRDRAHFFGFAATTMRHILVDRARARRAAKRGGGAPVVSLDSAYGVAGEREIDLLAFDEALHRLAELDARQARIVELRAFTGLSLVETAEAEGVSVATVSRLWASGKAFLVHRLREQASSSR